MKKESSFMNAIAEKFFNTNAPKTDKEKKENAERLASIKKFLVIDKWHKKEEGQTAQKRRGKLMKREKMKEEIKDIKEWLKGLQMKQEADFAKMMADAPHNDNHPKTFKPRWIQVFDKAYYIENPIQAFELTRILEMSCVPYELGKEKEN